MISTSNRFAVLGKKNVKKTYLAAAICGLVKEKERKAAMRRYVKTHPEVATRNLKIKHRSAKAERETLHERRAERTQRRLARAQHRSPAAQRRAWLRRQRDDQAEQGDVHRDGAP